MYVRMCVYILKFNKIGKDVFSNYLMQDQNTFFFQVFL